MSEFNYPIRKSSDPNISQNAKSVYLESPFTTEPLMSPYDGVVYTVDPKDCNGLIVIRHNFDNKSLYSRFCNVSSIQVYNGVRVKKGDLIGYLGGQKIKWTVVDDSGEEQKIAYFFTKKDTKTTTEEPPIEKKTEKNKKEKDSKKEKIYTIDDKDKFETKSGLLDFFLDVATLPLAAATFDRTKVKKKKEDEKEDEQLSEQIQRIKKLIRK